MRNTKASDFTRESGFLRPIALAPLPDRPLVSILMSNYDYGRYLNDSIESALHQTYRDLEVIICDDGSTDDSPRILERYRLLDPRIKVIQQANGGQSLALNAAFHKCIGDIICLLDADDVFLPDKLELVVRALIAAPDSGFAVNRMLLVDKDRKRLADIPSLHDLPSGWQGALPNCSGPRIVPGLPPTSGISLHRSLAEALFPLPAGLSAYSDTLIQVIAPLMTPIVAIKAPLSEYRIHGANVGGVSRFTEERLRKIVLYEKEIWSACRRYLSTLCSETPCGFLLPPEKPPSVMDYAYARYRSGKNVTAAYRAIPRAYLSLLPKPLRWYWRVSVMLPGWLFRWCFNFIYGHSRTKMIARRVLKALRNGVQWSSLPDLSVGKESPKTASSLRSIGKGRISSFQVLGVRVDAVQIADVVDQMKEWIRVKEGCHSIAATGMHGIVEAQHDPDFKQILNTTDLIVPDGTPLVWVGRYRDCDLPRRVYGPDLMLAFCEETQAQGYRHFFYGGEPGVAEELAESLKRRFPGMQVAGTYSPPFRPLTQEENEETLFVISHAAPDVLWVGLGVPKQERWMHELRSKLSVPVVVGVGAAFDMISGRRKQAPRWMREHGLEWLFRLSQEPRRLWRRYLIYGAEFVAWIVLETLGLRKFGPNTNEGKTQADALP